MEVIRMLEAVFQALLAIPGVLEAIGGLVGHLAPPFLIVLLVLWASGKFLKEDVAGKKFALAVSDALSDPDKKPVLSSELIPLVLCIESVLIGVVYCAVFGFGVSFLQRAVFAIVGGFGSGLAAYCVSAGLYDVAHGINKYREEKKEASK